MSTQTLSVEAARAAVARLASEWLDRAPGVVERIDALPCEVAQAVMARLGYDTLGHQALVGGLGDTAWTRTRTGWTRTEVAP